MRGFLSASAIAAVLLVPAAALAAQPAGDRRGSDPGVVDLAQAIGTDGTFQGIAGKIGTVDVSQWRIVSDLRSGEAPRFAPAHRTTQAVTATDAVAASWSGLGSNGSGDGAIATAGGAVTAMAVSGSNLYVAGSFINVANIPEADFVARWDGAAWHALGGSGGTSAINSGPFAIAVSGTDVYLGGSFTNAAGISEADFVAKWNGSFWAALGSNFAGDGALNNTVTALAVSGTDVYVAGYFENAATNSLADRLARWNGSSWSSMSASALDTPNGSVKALAVSYGALFAGGYFTDIGGFADADYFARWNGGNWEPYGGSLNNGVEAIAVAINGLPYIGGAFANAGGQATADGVARFDGTNWVALGSNGSGEGAIGSGVVRAIALSGSNVYIGGSLTDIGGVTEADHVAVFNGTSWSALGSNGSGSGPLNAQVRSLALGTSLFVGGEFTNAGGVGTADYIAAWGPLATYKPDGRIRKGSGTLVGNDVYNTTGLNQTRTGSTAPGNTITYRISAQNDGDASDRIKLAASGSAVTGYTIRYFSGTTDITSAVNAGTFRTPLLAAGGAFGIEARVTVKSTAATGSSVSRLLTLRSVRDPAKVDVVKFVGKRA